MPNGNPKCDKYFGGVSQCDANGVCGWTFLAASNYCRSFGKGFGLVKINNQYQNNAYNSLEGEGAWDLAWIGASCKQIPGATGGNIPAWTWQADASTLLDGYSNFDYSVDPTNCAGNQCLRLGGAGCLLSKRYVFDCSAATCQQCLNFQLNFGDSYLSHISLIVFRLPHTFGIHCHFGFVQHPFWKACTHREV